MSDNLYIQKFEIIITENFSDQNIQTKLIMNLFWRYCRLFDAKKVTFAGNLKILSKIYINCFSKQVLKTQQMKKNENDFFYTEKNHRSRFHPSPHKHLKFESISHKYSMLLKNNAVNFFKDFISWGRKVSIRNYHRQIVIVVLEKCAGHNLNVRKKHCNSDADSNNQKSQKISEMGVIECWTWESEIYITDNRALVFRFLVLLGQY